MHEMLEVISFEEFERDRLGESAYMLFIQDPDRSSKMRKVAVKALEQGNEDVTTAALYLYLHWQGEDAHARLERLISDYPAFQDLSLFEEIALMLREHGWLSLF
jgi:hypothetical protein